MSRARLTSLCWSIAVLLAACDGSSDLGPDAGRPPASRDSGAMDAGRDAGSPPSPVVDAAADAADAMGDDDAGVEVVGCGEGACDLFDPAGCGGDEGCVLLIAEESGAALTQCTEVGSGRDGDACDSYSECGPGLDCTGPGGNCRRPCCGLNQAAGCPAGQFCRIALTDAEGGATGVALCDRCDDCDPSDADACGDGLGCYALSGGGGCAACLPAGAASIGDGCARANDCEAGSGCFAVGSEASRCIAFCAMDGSTACEPGASCREVVGSELPDGVGLCQ